MGEWWYRRFLRMDEDRPPDKRPKKVAIFTMNNPIGVSFMESIYKGCKENGNGDHPRRKI